MASHLVFLMVLLGAFIFLVARSWSMFPSVFPDEFVHSRASQLIPLSSAEIPSYLYYWVYSLTAYFDDEFLKAARVLNAAFFVLGCYLVYMTVRRVSSGRVAAIIGTAAVFSPINTYTTYFMPESMFYFVFWILVYVLLSQYDGTRENKSYWIKVGVVLGVLSLVKPHALFIYPAILLYGIFVNGLNISTFKKLAQFTLFAAIIKFGVGFSLAGMDGLTFFGTMYTDHAKTVASDPQLLIDGIRSVSINLLGNFFLVTSVLGLGFMLLLKVTKMEEYGEQEFRLRILAASLMLILVPMVSVFSTSVALYDLHLDHRLYLRYYNFAFPLFYIMVAARNTKAGNHTITFDKAMLGSLFILFTAILPYYYTLSKLFYPFKLIMTDSPEFYLMHYYPVVLFAMSFIGIIVIGVWMFRESTGVKLYVYVFIPAFIIGTFISGFEVLKKRYEALPQDVLGFEYRNRIPAAEHSQITIIGRSRLVANHVALYSKSANTKQLLVENVRHPDSLSVHLNSTWLVLSDSISVPLQYQPIWTSDGMGIYKRADLSQ
jgi:phosphoglycerol transferase